MSTTIARRHFLLFYETAPDYLERRPQFRGVHLEKGREAKARGELVLGGVLDPPNRAVLLFQGENASVAENFAKTDPYVTNGLVTSWQVREWITVIGDTAAHSLPPGL